MDQQEIYESLLRHFPYEKIRSEQDAIFKAMSPWIHSSILDMSEGPKYFAVDAPTGVGKSAVAVASALAINEIGKALIEDDQDQEPTHDGQKKSAQVWIVTANKLLQDQYRNSHPELYDLRGLDNYDCDYDPGQTCATSKCGRIKPEQGKPHEAPKYCARTCGYDQAMAQAKVAPILLLNVAKAFALLKHPRFPKPYCVIFDEGHNVESALDSEASFSLDQKQMDKLDQRFEEYFPNLQDLDSLIAGCERLAESLATRLDMELSEDPDRRDAKKISRYQNLIKKIEEIVFNHQDGIPYVQCAADKLDLRPVYVHALFRKVFTFPTVFLSATLLSKSGFCSMVGLKDPELGWIAVDSPFPAKNRPVKFWWAMGAQAINYGNQSREIKNVFNRIREVLSQNHPKEKGIIHTHTYSNANLINEEFFAEYQDRLLFPKNAGEQKVMLQMHANPGRATVLLSPSMTEGVDLKDDLARFCCLVKVPYSPINDPVVKARMELEKEWYSYKTAMTIIQAIGRGVRHEDDYCGGYLFDPGFASFFGRARHHFPKWFLDSLVKGYHSHY